MASKECCAHCGKQGDGFKRCSICKATHYCGSACQKADWKRHKKECTTPVPPSEFQAKVDAARQAKDWRGVLKYEARMEEMLFCKKSGIANIPEDAAQLGASPHGVLVGAPRWVCRNR